MNSRSGPIWGDIELAGNPHERSDKAERVRGMFAAIAGKYDLNNRLHSFGRDQAWRRAAVRQARITPVDRVLDVACGTGDLARAFLDAGAARVVGLDYTAEMLDIARTKRLTPRGAHDDAEPRLTYIQGDAMALPFEDEAFDVVSIAFGIRNVAEPDRAMREFRRVLRPGGRLIVLEFAEPRFAPIRWASNLYTRRIMPWSATVVSGDRSGAYKYLARSVETFLTPEQLAQLAAEAGFGATRRWAFSFGVCVCTRADVPATPEG